MGERTQAAIFYGGALLAAALFGAGLWYGITTGGWQ